MRVRVVVLSYNPRVVNRRARTAASMSKSYLETLPGVQARGFSKTSSLYGVQNNTPKAMQESVKVAVRSAP